MSQLDHTSDMMAQLNASFSHAETYPGNTTQYPSAALHTRRETRAEDLDILSHAQIQLQTHLSATSIQTPDGSWHPQPRPSLQTQSHSQPQHHPHPQYHPQEQQPSLQPQSHSQPQHHPHQQCHLQAPRPRPALHLFTSDTLHPVRPDLRIPLTNPPFQWWENGVLISSPSVSNSDDDVRPSIEPADPDGPSVVQSIELGMSVAQGAADAEVKMEDVSDGEGERSWDGAQRDWNGCVQQRESWVRRAGLKREREREESGRHGVAKRGRV